MANHWSTKGMSLPACWTPCGYCEIKSTICEKLYVARCKIWRTPTGNGTMIFFALHYWFAHEIIKSSTIWQSIIFGSQHSNMLISPVIPFAFFRTNMSFVIHSLMKVRHLWIRILYKIWFSLELRSKFLTF